MCLGPAPEHAVAAVLTRPGNCHCEPLRADTTLAGKERTPGLIAKHGTADRAKPASLAVNANNKPKRHRRIADNIGR
jgi:hypothetical protein